MGGWAFMIYGSFEAQRAAAGAKPPSFFERLRGRKTAAVSSMDLGKSSRYHNASTSVKSRTKLCPCMSIQRVSANGNLVRKASITSMNLGLSH